MLLSKNNSTSSVKPDLRDPVTNIGFFIAYIFRNNVLSNTILINFFNFFGKC